MALTFYWSCESATFGSQDYSAGDSTPTANGASISGTQAFVGSNSVYSDDFGSYYAFDDGSIFDISEGSFGIATYITAQNDSEILMIVDASETNNHVRLKATGGDGSLAWELEIEQNLESSASVTTDYNTGDYDTWYYAVCRVHESNQDIRIEIYSAAGTLLGSAENLSTASGAFPAAADLDQIRIGSVGAGNSDMYLDNVIFDDDYSGPIEDYHDIDDYVDYEASGGGSAPVAGSLGLMGVGI